MIKSEITDHRKNNIAEVDCTITGTIRDFMTEFEAIMRVIKRNPLMVMAADSVIEKLAKEHNIDLTDCFRKNPDVIDIINTILKEMKEND